MKRVIVYSIIFILCAFNALLAQVTVTNLKCEWLVNPLGIDVERPRLSWQLQSDQRNTAQTAAPKDHVAFMVVAWASRPFLDKITGRDAGGRPC